jgi:hypothetical protein
MVKTSSRKSVDIEDEGLNYLLLGVGVGVGPLKTIRSRTWQQHVCYPTCSFVRRSSYKYTVQKIDPGLELRIVSFQLVPNGVHSGIPATRSNSQIPDSKWRGVDLKASDVAKVYYLVKANE